MKKFILYFIPAAVCFFNSCKKDGNSNTNIIPPVVPQISVQSITYPTFNSTWVNVIGGTGLIQLDLLGASGTVTATTKDSTNLSSIGSYIKTLSKGVYDIYISSKNKTSAADTFIRFNAVLKAYSVSGQQALSLTATSTDGLITVAKSFVQDNTVPTFKTDTGTKVYKLGLINGFYYLYIKGGLKGRVSFTSKTTQTLTKSLSIVALSQSNMAVQTTKSSLQVVFVPFVYNPLTVSSSTLVTVNTNPNNVILSTSSSAYFVITDESGNVLNEVKYIKGTSNFKISTLQPYTKDRFNFFEIYVPNDIHTKPGIIGFLQIKKGSVYNTDVSFSIKKSSPLKPHLINTTSFDELTISTNTQGFTINSLADINKLQQINYSDSTKLYVQMSSNNKHLYNLFDIPKGTFDYNIDISQLTKTALTKSLTAPGNNFQVRIYAKTDTNYLNSYILGYTNSPLNQLNIYYPSETFPEYDVQMLYSIGSLNYTVTTAGATIPDQVSAFDASFNVANSTLLNFKPAYSGTFDYYHANFQNTATSPNLQVDLYSPSAANYTNIKLPDFSKYLGVNSIDLNTLTLSFFGLYQLNGFKEGTLFYKDFHNYQNVNSKAVEHSY